MEAEVSEINANNLWGQVYAVSYVFFPHLILYLVATADRYIFSYDNIIYDLLCQTIYSRI